MPLPLNAVFLLAKGGSATAIVDLETPAPPNGKVLSMLGMACGECQGRICPLRGGIQP